MIDTFDDDCSRSTRNTRRRALEDRRRVTRESGSYRLTSTDESISDTYETPERAFDGSSMGPRVYGTLTLKVVTFPSVNSPMQSESYRRLDRSRWRGYEHDGRWFAARRSRQGGARSRGRAPSRHPTYPLSGPDLGGHVGRGCGRRGDTNVAAVRRNTPLDPNIKRRIWRQSP